MQELMARHCKALLRRWQRWRLKRQRTCFNTWAFRCFNTDFVFVLHLSSWHFDVCITCWNFLHWLNAFGVSWTYCLIWTVPFSFWMSFLFNFLLRVAPKKRQSSAVTLSPFQPWVMENISVHACPFTFTFLIFSLLSTLQYFSHFYIVLILNLYLSAIEIKIGI